MCSSHTSAQYKARCCYRTRYKYKHAFIHHHTTSRPAHLTWSHRFQAGRAASNGGRGRVVGKGEGPRENWEKVQVLWICRGVGVVPSRVIRDEYRM